jgi:hypothetical protein
MAAIAKEIGSALGRGVGFTGGLVVRAARQVGRAARSAFETTLHPRRAWQGMVARRRAAAPTDARSTPPNDGAGTQSAGPVEATPLADFAAARLAADDGLNALARALGDPDPKVRTLALDVVCEFSSDRAARLLAAMIHDPDASVRCAAAAASARLGAPRTVSSLIVALDDPESTVRAASAQAIEAITGRSVRLDDDRDPEEQRRAIEELKRWWKAERVAQLTASFDTRRLP